MEVPLSHSQELRHSFYLQPQGKTNSYYPSKCLVPALSHTSSQTFPCHSDNFLSIRISQRIASVAGSP